MNNHHEKAIKILLSLILFICLINMPYGYYLLVRFLAMVGFALLAYYAIKQRSETEVIVYIILCVLFQPLIKIALGRDVWNVVDVIVGAGLIVTLFLKKKTEPE
jgi:hypothetical protein